MASPAKSLTICAAFTWMLLWGASVSAQVTPAAPLDEQQARNVLDLAVALTLAGNDSQIGSLDQDYGSAMAATPLKDAFRLIAGTAAPSDADASALANLVEKAMAFRGSLATRVPPAAR